MIRGEGDSNGFASGKPRPEAGRSWKPGCHKPTIRRRDKANPSPCTPHCLRLKYSLSNRPRRRTIFQSQPYKRQLRHYCRRLQKDYDICYTFGAMNQQKGSITIPADTSPWDHELKAAHVLAQYGYRVEFIPENTRHKAKTADILINGISYEIKSPVASKLSAVERNLKRAYHQSMNIVFDSRRMKYLPDASIQRELVKQLRLTKNIKHLLFINRKREIVDIRTLI